MHEGVSSYGLSCCWIILFAGWRRTNERNGKEMKESLCILTSDLMITWTVGKKETLKCIPALNDRDERPSCLFGASAKSAQDFFLDHSLPRMQSCSYWNYQVSMRFCSWLKASSIRGLNSILPLQISIINHVIFFPSLHFPNNICMSPRQWLSTMREVIHLMGQFIMERNQGWMLTVSDPAL